MQTASITALGRLHSLATWQSAVNCLLSWNGYVCEALILLFVGYLRNAKAQYTEAVRQREAQGTDNAASIDAWVGVAVPADKIDWAAPIGHSIYTGANAAGAAVSQRDNRRNAHQAAAAANYAGPLALAGVPTIAEEAVHCATAGAGVQWTTLRGYPLA